MPPFQGLSPQGRQDVAITLGEVGSRRQEVQGRGGRNTTESQGVPGLALWAQFADSAEVRGSHRKLLGRPTRPESHVQLAWMQQLLWVRHSSRQALGPNAEPTDVQPCLPGAALWQEETEGQGRGGYGRGWRQQGLSF